MSVVIPAAVLRIWLFLRARGDMALATNTADLAWARCWEPLYLYFSCCRRYRHRRAGGMAFVLLSSTVCRRFEKDLGRSRHSRSSARHTETVT